MNIRTLIAACAAAILLAPVPASASGPQGVTRLEPGVHRVGKAEAPVTLTEYVSYTCPHCAHFEHEAGKELVIAYAAPGKASIVIRNLVRDYVDVAAALVANCGDADRFLANHSAIMNGQRSWMARLSATTPAQRARHSQGAFGARMQALARDAGFYDMMIKRGYSAVQLDRCLANEALADELAEKATNYIRQGVVGTPGFAIDGKLLPSTASWATLKPQLDARIAQSR